MANQQQQQQKREYEHATGILQWALDSNEWPETMRIQASGQPGGNKAVPTPMFLYHLFTESNSPQLLEQFWVKLGECHPKLKENIHRMKQTPLESPATDLREGVDGDIDYGPVLRMSEEIFTHLGIALMNPGGPKSGSGTSHSVDEVVRLRTDELLELVKSTTSTNKKYGARNQEYNKVLAIKRDGTSCLLTGAPFIPRTSTRRGDSLPKPTILRESKPILDPTPPGIIPELAHIIPHSVHDKVDTLKCISMFAGEKVADLVIKHLEKPGNAMNLQVDAHRAYDDMKWGIEAKMVDGKMKYFYRTIRSNVWGIRLQDGDEIKFGRGEDGERLGGGPIPELCNLYLAVGRVLHASGAADVISRWKEDADDSDIPESYVVSAEDLRIADAKLFMSGRVLMA